MYDPALACGQEKCKSSIFLQTGINQEGTPLLTACQVEGPEGKGALSEASDNSYCCSRTRHCLDRCLTEERGSAFLPPETEDETSELGVYVHGTLGKAR